MMDIDLAYLSQSDSEIVKETKEKKKRKEEENLTVNETKERKRNKR